MYINTQTTWIHWWRFWGVIDVIRSRLREARERRPLLQRAGKHRFCRGSDLCHLAQHSSLLSNMAPELKEKLNRRETQTQSQGVHEKPSNTERFELIYCQLRFFAIQHIVKYLNNWCNKLKKKETISGMSYILHQKSTWKYWLNSLYWFIPPGMKVHSTSARCCSEAN